jgi:hypothetical protein
MNERLALTWTPILKELPDTERERARELIEKYGETHPTHFIVELLEIFGIHATYLQTVPHQIQIAGERAKANAQQAMDAVTVLQERTRLELNELVSTVSRSGAAFTKALETSTAAQVRAAETGAKDVQTTIEREFTRQNLPAITGCLKEIREKSNQSLETARHINEQAGQYMKCAQDRLTTSERLCRESLSKIENFNWGAAWLLSITTSFAVMAIIGSWLFWQLRSHDESVLADKIASAARTMAQNREAFAQLAVANIRLTVVHSSDADGKIIPDGFAILVQNADGAEMRDYAGRKAGCVFVTGRTPAEEIQKLELPVEKLLDEAHAGNTTNQPVR